MLLFRYYSLTCQSGEACNRTARQALLLVLPLIRSVVMNLNRRL